MIELRTKLLACLLMWLAAIPEASPQTAQSGPPTRQVVVRKTGKSGNNRSSLATGTTPGPLPGLCFQPGVGWQTIPLEPPGVPATPGTNGSIGLEVSRSTSVANAQSIHARSSSAKQAYAAECAGNSINKKALGAGAEKLTTLNRPQAMRSAGSTKPGTVTSLHVNSLYHNSPYHANGSAGLESVGMTPSAMPPAPTYFSSEAESDAHPDQVGVRAFHAYTSSIKLRRLIRNAPDFRTRIKLQQLQNNPATQLHKARVVTKTGAAAGRPLQGEHASRTSSWRSDTHGRPRDNPRTRFSGAYR
jgi:hypothetical protein